ncbi:MAG TPA: hypothetical protein VKA73_07690 [Rubrobacter sp.]|nr:hypothetical protein [Rubrobacter sp.]
MRRRLALACVVMLIGVLLVGGGAFAAGFRGTSGPDDISGTDGKDTIRGLGGNDRLSGRGGPDEIYGGSGRDKIFGNSGDDRIMADDGTQDIIDCGKGKDFVFADRSDVINYGCETVKRPL